MEVALRVLERVLLAVRDVLVGDRGVRDFCMSQCPVQPARDLALTELGPEEADEVDTG